MERKDERELQHVFLDSSQTEKFERTTTFNNKDTKFHHSLYISSDYFNHFVDDATGEKNLFGTDNTSPKDKVFKTLVKKLKCFLEEKQKKYVAEVASKKLLENISLKVLLDNRRMIMTKYSSKT